MLQILIQSFVRAEVTIGIVLTILLDFRKNRSPIHCILTRGDRRVSPVAGRAPSLTEKARDLAADLEA